MNLNVELRTRLAGVRMQNVFLVDLRLHLDLLLLLLNWLLQALHVRHILVETAGLSDVLQLRLQHFVVRQSCIDALPADSLVGIVVQSTVRQTRHDLRLHHVSVVVQRLSISVGSAVLLIYEVEASVNIADIDGIKLLLRTHLGRRPCKHRVLVQP